MNITHRIVLAASLILFPATGARAVDDWLYVINPGDTLVGIAGAYLPKPGDWRKLQHHNRVADPRHLLPGSSLRIPVGWLKQEAVAAEVVRVQGDVRRIVKDGAQPLSSGDRLAPGDTVSTGAASNLTLRFGDGSRLLVSQNSRISFTRMMRYGKTGMTHTSIHLREGNVATQVAQQKGSAARYEIESQALNLGVRGTDFRVGVEADGLTRSEVLEGRVIAAGSGVAVALGGGFGTFAAPGKPPSPPIPLPAAPDLGGLPARLDRVPLRFTWPGQPGIARYRAEVFSARSPEMPLLEGVFPQPGAKWLDLPDGKYLLRVRGIDSNGLEGLDAQREFALKARPEPPLVVMPPDGATVHGDQTTLRWTRPANARDFRLQLAATSDFAVLLSDMPLSGDTEHAFALAPGQYYWRVASVAADGDQGPFSDVQGFTQRRVPQSPSVAPPQMDGERLSFRWKAGEAGQKFRVQLARDGGFRDMLSDTLVDSAQFSMARPQGGTYFLRIQTQDSDGFEGPFGQAQRIEVPAPETFPSWLFLLVPLLFAL